MTFCYFCMLSEFLLKTQYQIKKNCMKKILSAAFLILFATFITRAEETPSTTTIDGNDYYQLGTAEELTWFATQINAGNTDINAILTNNIVLNENLTTNKLIITKTGASYNIYKATIISGQSVNQWTPIGNSSTAAFGGIFDGNGKTISGIYVVNQDSKASAGLFGFMANGTIKNLTITDSHYLGYNKTGIFVGTVIGGGTVKNCRNTNSVYVKVSNQYTGGIVGGCDKSSSTEANTGLIIEDCHNHANINGYGYTAGIIGGSQQVSVEIRNCSNNSSTLYLSDSSGGIAGSIGTATIENCFNTGNFSVKRNGGGIIGMVAFSGLIKDCYNTGDIKCTYMGESGGIVGKAWGCEINGCYNTGNYTSTAEIHYGQGGIIGETADNECLITNCYNTGDIRSENSTTGDLGGIAGVAKCDITNCYNTGAIYSANGYVGGIAGKLFNSMSTRLTCSNSYNNGDIVSEKMATGGIVGFAQNANIRNCYFNSSIDAAKEYGAIVGYYADAGTLSGNYYDNEKFTGRVYGYRRGGVNIATNSGLPSSKFASGEAAYIMQSAQSSHIWGQDIKVGNSDTEFDEAPTLGGKKVYIGYPCETEGDGMLTINDPDGITFTNRTNVESVTFNRTFAAGKLGTVTLPFTPDENSTETLTFYTIDSKDGNKLLFTEVSTPMAGVPYIWKNNGETDVTSLSAAYGDMTIPTANASTTKNSDGDWSMLGTYSLLNITNANELSKSYYLSNNKVMNATASLTVKPHRAYFQGPDYNTLFGSAAGQQMSIELRGEGGTTFIENVTIESNGELNFDNATYDLGGRRTDENAKGLLIRNGKKIFVK